MSCPIDCAGKLIEAKASVTEVTTKTGSSPTYIASQNGRLPILQILVQVRHGDLLLTLPAPKVERGATEFCDLPLLFLMLPFSYTCVGER